MSSNGRIETYEDFVKVHGVLLAASGLPRSLHRQLFDKLSSDRFDGGACFQIEPCEGGRRRRLVLTSEFMAKDSHCFLVDHAWTFRLSDAYKQLREVPGLAQRMASLMCVDIDLDSDSDETDLAKGDAQNNKVDVGEVLESEVRKAKEEGDGTVRWLELDDLDIDDDLLLSLDLSNKFQDLHALSLCDNKLHKVEVILPEVTKFKQLRALWLNNNPFPQKDDDDLLSDAILQGSPRLEIYNSRFTHNYGDWALGFCGGVRGKDNLGCNDDGECPLQSVTSLDLSDRGIHNLIDKPFSADKMPSLSHLNLRGNPLEQTSVGYLLKVLKKFPLLNSLEVDIPGPLGESAVEILESLPTISMLNGVNASKILETGKNMIDSMLPPRLPEWIAKEPLADRVVNAMWLYLMSYRLADEEKIDETSVWYVMDELGSAMQHNDEPNFRVAPFLFLPKGNLESAISYSILWPTKNVEQGDECTRDFLLGIGEDKQRSARLTAWFRPPHKYFIQEFEKHLQKSQSTILTFTSPNPSTAKSVCRIDGSASRVYTDIPHVEDYLTRSDFVITTELKDADIIWTSEQLYEDLQKAAGVTDQQYINQFPSETCLVMKHNLAETIQKAYGTPKWLQTTYNLETSLSQFIGDYFVRQRDGLNNLWILKPWNMARTIDTTVTGDISAIIRLMETGPKICQKYIEHPALFKGRKFDLRYIVLVRSINPLEMFLTDVFWARLANNPYSLNKHSFFEYETHFTVMNYCGKLNHMNTPEFVREFEQEHQVKWLDIHGKIKNMIRSVFEAAATVHPEMHSPTSRAMYGVDVMLDSNFEPKLLEVTYCPDCGRACNYDTESIVGDGELVKGSEFFNVVFGCLFLNETTNVSPL